MRAQEFLLELELPKKQWVMVLSTADKEEVGHELINLVQNAYTSAPQGSFVNSLQDVMPSDWNVINWDQDPEIDACIFFRGPRGHENWQGDKIQGIGHDGTRTSKDYVITRLRELLQKPGYWLEASDAMRRVLQKLQLPAVTDVKLLQQIFSDPELRMVSHDTYVRRIRNQPKEESVFGHPQVRGHK